MRMLQKARRRKRGGCEDRDGGHGGGLVCSDEEGTAEGGGEDGRGSDTREWLALGVDQVEKITTGQVHLYQGSVESNNSIEKGSFLGT